MNYNLPEPTLIGTLPAFGIYYHQVYGYTEDQLPEIIKLVKEQVKKECAEICFAEARMHEHQDKNGRSVHLDYADVATTCGKAILNKM